MSDSQPPVWGPEPYDDGDLDAVLSGQVGGLPDALRPLAATLTALRAAPVPAELDREEATRAAFRLLFEPFAADDGARDDRAAGLPHRHRRPAPRRSRWQAAVLLGAAAAAAVLVVALSGHGARPGQPGPGAGTAPAIAAAGSTAKPALDGGATRVPTPRPTPRAASQPAAASGPVSLCRQLAALATHPWQPSDQAAENKVIGPLSALAGGWRNVYGYCSRQLRGQPGTGGFTRPGRGWHGGFGGPARDRSPFGAR